MLKLIEFLLRFETNMLGVNDYYKLISFFELIANDSAYIILNSGWLLKSVTPFSKSDSSEVLISSCFSISKTHIDPGFLSEKKVSML